MTDHPRALALLAQVTRGLFRHGEQRTAQNLGDRSTYVGLSDVGRAITCLRAAVAGKLGNGAHATGDDIANWLHNGQEPRIRDTLRRQLILQRGHWLEGGVEAALCLSMSDAKPFGPYRPKSTMLALCRRTAQRLWTTTEAVKAGRLNLADVEFCSGFHPLCDWCDHADVVPNSYPIRSTIPSWTMTWPNWRS